MGNLVEYRISLRFINFRKYKTNDTPNMVNILVQRFDSLLQDSRNVESKS